DAELLDIGGRDTCTARNGLVHCFGELRSYPADTQVGEFVAYTAGGGFSCVLRGSGDVDCWGSNEAGKLGDLTTISHLDPRPVLGLPPVTAIDTYLFHVCALGRDGR